MLDEMEAMLSKSRFLLGDQVTFLDLRAFPTLARFDIAYTKAFGCNLGTLCDNYPNVSDYLREMYSLPGWRETMNLPAYLFYLTRTKRHWPEWKPLPQPQDYLPF